MAFNGSGPNHEHIRSNDDDLDREKNYLEKYLNDVYIRECEFTIKPNEVSFIQRGIENLVQKIVDILLENNIQYAIDMDDEYKNYLQEAQTLLKVGSFYDGTKNGFPDEFDFIFCIRTFRRNSSKHWSDCNMSFLSELGPVGIQQKIMNVLEARNREILSYFYQSSTYGKIHFVRSLEERGPAITLVFNYTRETGEEFSIHVDLVGALKIENNQLEFADNICELKPFYDDIVSTGSYLSVQHNISVTETEVHFIKNILSPEHFKVYRILKYLINGHVSTDSIFTTEDMKPYKKDKFKLSSYKIKTAVIYHHYACSSEVSTGIGPCVLDVLDFLTDPTFPSLLKKTEKPYEYERQMYEEREGKYLKKMILSLKKLKCLKKGYNYDQDKLKPIAESWRKTCTKIYTKRCKKKRPGMLKQLVCMWSVSEL